MFLFVLFMVSGVRKSADWKIFSLGIVVRNCLVFIFEVWGRSSILFESGLPESRGQRVLGSVVVKIGNFVFCTRD